MTCTPFARQHGINKSVKTAKSLPVQDHKPAQGGFAMPGKSSKKSPYFIISIAVPALFHGDPELRLLGVDVRHDHLYNVAFLHKVVDIGHIAVGDI